MANFFRRYVKIFTENINKVGIKKKYLKKFIEQIIKNKNSLK